MTRGSLLGIVAGGLLLLSLIEPPSLATAVPVREAKASDLRTYRFRARIRSNAGVTPFKVKEVIDGEFTYDLRARDPRAENANWGGHFESANNALWFRIGDERFVGTGKVIACVSKFDATENTESNEHFGVVAHDLKLPKGWEIDHESKSNSFGFIFQNVPDRKVLARKLPDEVVLSEFVNTREFRVDFWGVKFPGGEVKERATVMSDVESLEPAGDNRK
jgi:hypothetical protein